MTGAEDRASMDAALKTWVVPELRRRGFKGSAPHFRRSGGNGLEYLTIQFSQWGGQLAVELARCSADGFVNYNGQTIQPSKTNTWTLPGTWRRRLSPHVLDDAQQDHWIDFSNGRANAAAKEILVLLDAAEAWYQADARASGERPLKPDSYY